MRDALSAVAKDDDNPVGDYVNLEAAIKAATAVLKKELAEAQDFYEAEKRERYGR